MSYLKTAMDPAFGETTPKLLPVLGGLNLPAPHGCYSGCSVLPVLAKPGVFQGFKMPEY
jgi:hypothetical protein